MQNLPTYQDVILNDSIDSQPFKNDVGTLLTVLPPKGNFARTSLDLCAIIDVSGSMSTEARLSSGETFGLSILDVVKHAMKTIIESMREGDRLSIVTFSSTAKLEIPMTYMTDDGKEVIEQIVDSLKPLDTTNLWDGLKIGLSQFNTRRNAAFPVIYILTDGDPNVTPPRGEEYMLKEYKKNYVNLPEINTFGFGFGNSLNSKLLLGLGEIGEGQYYYIPDSSLVGTIFIHALTKSFTTYATNISISIKGKYSIYGFDYIYDEKKGETTTSIGTLQYDQQRNIIVINDSDNEEFSYQINYYEILKGNISIHCGRETTEGRMMLFEYNKLRLELANLLISRESSDISLIGELVLKAINIKLCEGLLKDLKGQISEAYLPEYFHKWGKHYLPSLGQAYKYENCNNFKDYGVQIFVGKMGEEIRDTLDKIFLTIVPPKPTIIRRGNVAVSMTSFHNSNNPCFTGESLVTMYNGKKKEISLLKKKDVIHCNGYLYVVVCVLETKVTDVEIIQMNEELGITLYHPMYIDGKWVFPKDTGEMRLCLYTGSIYSVILDYCTDKKLYLPVERLIGIEVGGIICAVLGHGITGDPIIEHEYLGTTRIIEDISKKVPEQWRNGKVIVKKMLRDSITKRINGIEVE